MREKDVYMKNSSQNPELLSLSKIGIYDETDKLQKAAIWGDVGAETVLTQLYPPQISLFQGEMNVPRVREEVDNFTKTLAECSVDIIPIRDHLASTLSPRKSLTIDKVLKAFINKTKQDKLNYGNKELNDKHIEILEWFLQEDISKYGKIKALTLNWELSVKPDLPLGNSIYARDQMNVILGKMIRSSMKEPIRQPEVNLYARVYKELGLASEIINIPSSETFEGGDAFVHASTIYIGVGMRTSLGAARYIYEALKKDLEKNRYNVAVVVEEDPQKRSHHEQMSFMHLDAFFNPVGKNEVVVCADEAERKTVKVFTAVNGESELISTGKSLIQYLEEQNQKLIEVPSSEQKNFGCNFLTIDENTVIVPDINNTRTVEELKKAGKRVIRVPLAESTEGYGAAHCMVGQLLRNNN